MRYPDWVSRLEAYIASVRNRPFAYGEFDCFLFAAGTVQAISGVDPAAPWRQSYGSRREARYMLSAAGGYSQVFRASGLEEIPAGVACRGDVIGLSRFGLGVLSLDGLRAYVPIAEGLALVQADRVGKAWRI